MPTVALTLKTAQSDFRDIQICSPEDAPYLRAPAHLVFVALVNYKLIPLYLVSNGPYPVYSDDNDTEAFFIRSLVCQNMNVGLLAKCPELDGDLFVVFYVDELSSGIKCFCLDFSIIAQALEFREMTQDSENTYYVSRTKWGSLRSDTSVFDRVLENKSSRKSFTQSPSEATTHTSLLLTTPAQISLAINKIILLGLRLRGLTASGLSSAKDKIAIREIHQMTRKATLFAVRKFKYDFNAGETHHELLLSVLQDIVESLLQAFVDIPKK
ncbi:hypothetical protein PUMCH_002574 [Australozyma saopauloensis]|uniref:Sld7 C-terminal domain-containing protein n=1 Tax=Australozyma saopauloensis TaxID=291208 RepID=A0AAX4HA33_9ASCO|nr:hypothetical protein PUMCH_002574 [[Candida] saopauloensis]